MSATLTVTLQSHRHSRGAWAVAELRVVSGTLAYPAGSSLRASGPRLGTAQVGEQLRITLEEDNHPVYGWQFKVAEQESLGIQTTQSATRWLERLHGVGPALAMAISAKFGSATLEVLSTTPPGFEDPLTKVSGISPAKARLIRESWSTVGTAGNAEDVRYLDGLGLSQWEVSQVLAACMRAKQTPQELLQSNPYCLTTAKGLGFKRVDNIALRAGCSRLAPARISAACIYHLGEVTKERGATQVSLADLIRGACELTGCKALNVLDALRSLGRQVPPEVEITKQDGKQVVIPSELAQAAREVAAAIEELAHVEPAPPAVTDPLAGGDSPTERTAEGSPPPLLCGCGGPLEVQGEGGEFVAVCHDCDPQDFEKAFGEALEHTADLAAGSKS